MPLGQFDINYYPEISPFRDLDKSITMGFRAGTESRRVEYQKQYQDEVLQQNQQQIQQNQQKINQQQTQQERDQDLAVITKKMRLFDSVVAAGGDSKLLNSILQDVVPDISDRLGTINFGEDAKEAGNYLSKLLKQHKEHGDDRLFEQGLFSGWAKYPRQQKQFKEAIDVAREGAEQRNIQLQRSTTAKAYEAGFEGQPLSEQQQANIEALRAGVAPEDLGIGASTAGVPKTFEAGVMQFVQSSNLPAEQKLSQASALIATHKEAIAQPGFEEDKWNLRQKLIATHTQSKTFDRMQQELILSGVPEAEAKVVAETAEEGSTISAWDRLLRWMTGKKISTLDTPPGSVYVRTEEGKKIFKMPNGTLIREK
jgi:hypothetical protein